MLALLLALSPGAVAFQASAPIAHAQSGTDAAVAQSETDALAAQNGPLQSGADGNVTNDTTGVMTLGTAPTRTAFDRPSLALGSSLATDYDGFQTQLGVNTLDQQLSAAGSDEEQRRILNRYQYRIDNRIISLEAREGQATQSFVNGTLSKSEYLRTLGQIDLAAAETRQQINALEERTDEANFGFDARSMEAKLASLEGPVRNHVGTVVDGSDASTRIYVEAGDNGVILSMIDDGQYVREVSRTDNRNPGETGSMSFEEAENEIIGPQFPWVMDIDNINGGEQRQYSSLSVLRFIYFHQHGQFTAYLDTSTEQIYRTIQRKHLAEEDSVPPGPGVVESSTDLRLAVNRTYAGGPLRVRLTNETGAPVESEITVDGEPVGRTSDNGVLWTLGPAEQFTVGATHDGRSVNVTTTPVDPR